jgi:hypothetical protein
VKDSGGICGREDFHLHRDIYNLNQPNILPELDIPVYPPYFFKQENRLGWEVRKMTMPRKDEIQREVAGGWRTFVENLETGLNMLEKDIDEAAGMADACTSEWCQATEHVIDELSNSLFSISEPSWSSAEDSRKIKVLKRRVHDLYAKYKTVSKG